MYIIVRGRKATIQSVSYKESYSGMGIHAKLECDYRVGIVFNDYPGGITFRNTSPSGLLHPRTLMLRTSKPYSSMALLILDLEEKAEEDLNWEEVQEAATTLVEQRKKQIADRADAHRHNIEAVLFKMEETKKEETKKEE